MSVAGFIVTSFVYSTKLSYLRCTFSSSMRFNISSTQWHAELNVPTQAAPPFSSFQPSAAAGPRFVAAFVLPRGLANKC